ncbi:MAG: ABC transporter ATP-binding protein [Acidimicrobiia bacterium]|nr:ABC transporter ATP-binding protein [Acidimicrobiia bacterium]
MSSLTLTGVRKQFADTVALDHFDLDVADGELISLLGPSGCGKTTALRVVAGFEHPDSGTVEVGGNPIAGLAPNKREMGMVFQAYSLFPHLTAAENVSFGLKMRGLKGRDAKGRVMEMLDLVGLADRSTSFPHQLSGGQQQRVALARALAIRPSVLLLDEPLSALDAKVRVQLRSEIRRIQTEVGITTLFVTHDQEEALAIADRIGVMSNGHLEQLASPADVYERPATAFVARFVGKMNEIPARVVAMGAVSVEGATITGFSTDGRAADTPVQLLVRPEHLSLSTSLSGHLRGRVTAVSFHGPRSEVTVRTDPGGTVLAVDLPTADAKLWSANDHVGIGIDPDKAFVD